MVPKFTFLTYTVKALSQMAHCDLYIVRKHFDFSCSLDLSSRYPLLDHEANSDYFCRNVLFYNASFTLYLQKTSKHHKIKIT